MNISKALPGSVTWNIKMKNGHKPSTMNTSHLDAENSTNMGTSSGFLDSTTGATSWLGVSPDLDINPKINPKEGRRRGHKSAQQLIKEAGNYLINSGQVHRLP
jgi:hypothetical protein